MEISVVLTTHNRPDLLVESVRSVLAQTSPEWELIIVDDGSRTPVTLEEAGAAAFGDKVRIVRHPEPRSVSAARNSGIEAATHDFVTFVDDDDLLVADALRTISRSLASTPDVDCLFLNVEPFGPLAEGTKENQDATMARILAELGCDARTGAWIVPDANALFIALLKGMPMAFQRPVLRKSALASKVGGYTGQGFGDIEFYYRVALRCRCAIFLESLYRVRCQGQSYFSRTDSQGAMLDAVIKIRQALLSLPEVRATPLLSREVQKSLSGAHFEKAYLAFTRGTPFAWDDFAQSMRSGVGWRHLSLLLKLPFRSRKSPAPPP